MSVTANHKPVSQEFDIHTKLKEANSHWSYLYAAQPHESEFNYQFNTTSFIGEMEFAVYERIDKYFVLVDFFKSYDEACDAAKKIIDDHPDIKKMFSAI
ncbi:TPA: hypothetical protein R4Y37_003533 [Citrobacter freundii]|nr:hypothetical protein [Citrobacter freundii]